MISVIMATYNRAALLPRAIRSLLAQTCTEWELVLVDDGSSDNTRAMVAEYQQNDSRIRYFYQENQGLTGARNKGLETARGQFLTFLDSDDEYRPRHLQLRVEYMINHPEIDLLHGGVEVTGGIAYVPDRFDPCRLVPLEDCFLGGTFFMRRHVAEALGGFRLPDYGNDYDFIMRARERFRIGKMTTATYVYHRDTPDSMCNVMEKDCR